MIYRFSKNRKSGDASLPTLMTAGRRVPKYWMDVLFAEAALVALTLLPAEPLLLLMAMLAPAVRDALLLPLVTDASDEGDVSTTTAAAARHSLSRV